MPESRYMEKALSLAREAASEKEIPVGAVIVRKSDGCVVGCGRNRREKSRNALAHAEIEAIDNACRTLGGWRLSGCEMYVTLEPCLMCTGAIVNARIDNVIFGAFDRNSEACLSADMLREMFGPRYPDITGGFMEGDSVAILKKFFYEIRRMKMNSINLVKAETDDQLRRVEKIAGVIWREYFPGIISREQTEYMLEKFCSYDAMKQYIANEDYSYYILKKEGRDIGYTALKPDGDRLFLSKLYLFKEERGKKYARRAMENISEIARNTGKRSVWLTVNRHNSSTIAAYKALGFKVTGQGKADIGNGFVMDDYYMELTVDTEGR